MTNSENRPFLTIKEVSKLIGLSVSTINRLVEKEEFPPKIKISPRRMVFMKKQIEEWIDKKNSDWQ
tara:strand:+ start:106 stop:303 length:198 start_codon:yes stop_codon:yes gene_type:complete